MRSIEARFGKPLEVLLPEMLESCPTQREVAKAFGVHGSAINHIALEARLAEGNADGERGRAARGHRKMKMVRFYASDWLRKEINRRVRRARHQGRITTTAGHVIRELLHHAIAAQGAGRSKRALKARALRQPRALQDLQVPRDPVRKARPKDGQEKEGIAVLAGAHGGPVLHVAECDRELPAFGPDH